MRREPVTATPRKVKAKASGRYARLAQRDGECCAIKDCDSPGPYEVDHVICLGIGGKDTDDNCRLLCVPHHKEKTARDFAITAKCKRNEAKENGTFPKAQGNHQIRSAGFAQTARSQFAARREYGGRGR